MFEASRYLELAILGVSTLVLIIALFCLLHKRTNIKNRLESEQVLNRSQDVQPHAVFVDLSPKSTDVVDLAVEVWRLNNRISKIGNGLSDIQKRGIESSLQKFTKFLDNYSVKIIDSVGEKYNEGMNLDVLSFEKDPNLKMPLIKETVEPSITCKGQIIKKGKIIVASN